MHQPISYDLQFCKINQNQNQLKPHKPTPKPALICFWNKNQFNYPESNFIWWALKKKIVEGNKVISKYFTYTWTSSESTSTKATLANFEISLIDFTSWKRKQKNTKIRVFELGTKRFRVQEKRYKKKPEVTISSCWRQTESEQRPNRNTRTSSMVSLMIRSISSFFVNVFTR